MSQMVTKSKTSIGEIIIDCDIEKARKYENICPSGYFTLASYEDNYAWIEYDGEAYQMLNYKDYTLLLLE